MNKEKLIKGGMWLSCFCISIFFSAISLYIGFNNADHGDYFFLIIGILIIPLIFFCAYKGFKFISESIFD